MTEVAIATAAAHAQVRSAAPGDGEFQAQCLSVLVRYSAGLRFQMHTIAVVIAGVGLAGGVPWPAVLAWLLATITVREVRAAALLRLDRDAQRPILARMRTTAAWTLALGAAYGASSLFMLRMDTAFDAILTMILMSLSAGAVSTTFTNVPAFIAFAAGIAVPLAALWTLTGKGLGLAMAVLILMFAGVQVRFARQNMQMFETSWRMRLENAELLRALSEERARLAQARDMAVAADLSKSRFLAAASHDLRQPLQSLSLNSGALSRLPMSDESREIAAEMGVSIEALRRMLDQLLDVSQLDAGAVLPEMRPIQLPRLLEGLCQRFRTAAHAKQLTLDWRCAADVVVMSDAQMLQRVLSNLIDNALKFTRQGGVSLSAEPAPDGVHVVVADTGCGIDPAYQARVFEDLLQLGNPQRDRALGHGLGLGIVRRLSRLLGIEVSIESQLGAGSRFSLRLPRAGDAAALVSDPLPAYPALVARRILVLDDDASVRSAYAKALTGLGSVVHAAATPTRALDLLAAYEFDVALVDFRLAGPLDGIDVVREMRARQPALAALIVSADSSESLRSRAAEAGVPMLRKPVTDTLLASSIHHVMADAARRRSESA
jgi:signal transduction histidine kinase/ActR/RegA family two-component response regulator